MQQLKATPVPESHEGRTKDWLWASLSSAAPAPCHGQTRTMFKSQIPTGTGEDCLISGPMRGADRLSPINSGPELHPLQMGPLLTSLIGSPWTAIVDLIMETRRGDVTCPFSCLDSISKTKALDQVASVWQLLSPSKSMKRGHAWVFVGFCWEVGF